jgi:L-threonine-O-3-phosphate decarboxylase
MLRSGDTCMPPEARPELRYLADVTHGALDFAELELLGLAPQDVLDFSVNGNPYGPSPRVQEALTGVALERYPDREALALRRALAAHLDVPLEGILVGNGSVELLWLTALAFLRPDDAVLIVGPTFGEYARAAAIMGARLYTWTAQVEEAFRIDPAAVLHTMQRLTPRLVFVCNPNNPTGTYLGVDTIMAWAAALPQTLFLIDEAYLPFATGAASVIGIRCANLLVLRSMTKAQALAGVRLGYAVAHPEVIRALALVRPPWNVNALAQAAGIAALHDQAHVVHTLAQLASAKEALLQGLRASGLAVVPSCTHFFLLHVGDATACRQALLQHGIVVRDCTSFGLPEYIRVATRRAPENARLLAALAQVR